MEGMIWITRTSHSTHNMFFLELTKCFSTMHPHQVQKLLLVLLICSQIDFVVGSFLDSDPYERAQVISIVVILVIITKADSYEGNQGFTGYNWNTTMANMGSGYKV